MTTTHIEKTSGDWDAPLTVVVAFCGASAVITDDGAVTPSDFDFVTAEHRAKADCEPCYYVFWFCRLMDNARRSADEMALKVLEKAFPR